MAEAPKKKWEVAVSDPRNPLYYIRRAGHPESDLEWYANRDKKGEVQPMGFSRENFVRGFNLTPGEFYILRRFLIDKLLPNGLYSKNFGKPTTQFEVAPIHKDLREHELLKDKGAHPYWYMQMIDKSCSSTAQWMEKLLKKDPDAFTTGKMPTERWVWVDEINPSKLLAYCQYQHLILEIRREDQEDSPFSIQARRLVDEGDLPAMISHEDLDISVFKFHNLEQQIKGGFEDSMDWPDFSLSFNPSGSTSEAMITSDRSLHAAMTDLRRSNTGIINVSLHSTVE